VEVNARERLVLLGPENLVFEAKGMLKAERITAD
jgi:hypothetical protein